MAQPQENASDIGAVFYVCARSDGDCSPLRREELRQLIEQEFADAMENPQDPKTVKKLLRFLDDDSNRRLDFSELLSLVFRTAKACYKPLQQGQAPEDGQEPREQEKAGREQPPGPRTVGRVSRNQQDAEQGVNSQDEDTETQDPNNPQTQEGETQGKDQDNRQTQEGETPEQDQDNRQTQEDETSEQDQDNRQTQEGETPEQDQDNHQIQEGETPEQNEDDRQTQEGEAKEQDQGEDGRAEEPEGDPERGEILGTVTPERARNTHEAEETEAPKRDPKTHQAKETEAQGQGSNHHQSPEKESAEQDLNCPSETRGRDPNNKTQDCEAPQQDPNPGKTQKLLPLQRVASPHRDPKPQGTHHDKDFHRLPESKVLEQEHNGAEAPSCPAQQPQDVHQHIQPPIEQQVLQSLYQWPPQ